MILGIYLISDNYLGPLFEIIYTTQDNNNTHGNSCHIWRTLAVLWTHFCVDKTADLGSFMDTFLMLRMLRKLLDLGSFMDTFPTE